jgi:hypothetical protein
MPALDAQVVCDVLLPSTHCTSITEHIYFDYPLLIQYTQNGLERYRIRIHIAMGLIVITFIVVIMTIFLSCRPFHHYWQINPDPGNACQAAVSKPIIWVSFVSNVSTDVFLFLIPVPMLWKSTLRLLKKIAATLVLSAGVFIIVCATLKSVYVIVVSDIAISYFLLHVSW